MHINHFGAQIQLFEYASMHFIERTNKTFYNLWLLQLQRSRIPRYISTENRASNRKQGIPECEYILCLTDHALVTKNYKTLATNQIVVVLISGDLQFLFFGGWGSGLSFKQIKSYYQVILKVTIISGKGGQSIKKDKLYQSENLANFGFLTSIISFFWRSTS